MRPGILPLSREGDTFSHMMDMQTCVMSTWWFIDDSGSGQKFKSGWKNVMRCRDKIWLDCPELTNVKSTSLPITFAGLLYIAEKPSTMVHWILSPAWFPVGLDSITDSYFVSFEKWKGRKYYSLQADPARHMSRHQLWSLQEFHGELLQSIHLGVLRQLRDLDEASWESLISVLLSETVSHLAPPRGTCIIQQL